MLRHVIKLWEDASAREIAQEAVTKAVDSKAVAATVAAGTAALGLSDIQSIAQLAATIAAFLLSVTLIIKHAYDVYRAYKSGESENEE